MNKQGIIQYFLDNHIYLFLYMTQSPDIIHLLCKWEGTEYPLATLEDYLRDEFGYDNSEDFDLDNLIHHIELYYKLVPFRDIVVDIASQTGLLITGNFNYTQVIFTDDDVLVVCSKEYYQVDEY